MIGRGKFANDFLSLCIQKCLPDLIEGMPYEKQIELSRRINFMPPEKQEIVILEFIPQETFDNALLDVTIKTLKDYLDSIRLTLSEDQKTKLDAYIVKVTGVPQSDF